MRNIPPYPHRERPFPIFSMFLLILASGILGMMLALLYAGLA